MSHNEKITEELMSNIKASGTTSKDLSKLFCKRLVGVRLSSSRGRMQVVASDTALGIKTKASTTTASTFKKKNIKSGAFLLFNEDVIKSFDNLYSIIRQTMTRYSISKEGSMYYMTTENFTKFKKIFDEKYVPSFNEAKESLVSNLDTYRKSFEDSLGEWLKEVIEDETTRDRLSTYYISKFPTSEEIQRDCNLQLLLSAYPIVENSTLTGVDYQLVDEIVKSSNESSIDTLYQMTLGNLEEAFKVIEKVSDSIDIVTSFDADRVLNLNMGSRTKGLLNSTIEYIENNNYVLQNDFLGALVDVIKRTFVNQKTKDGRDITNEEAVNTCENLMGIIYGYANHIEMQDEFEEDVLKSSKFDADTLELLSSLNTIDDL